MGRRDTIAAIPPENFKGSNAAWQTALIERGLWDGQGWYGDIEIPENDWWDILYECED